MKFKKALKTIITGAMCLSMTLGITACQDTPSTPNVPGDKNRVNDTEMRPVTLAIGNLDGTFNPFFFTAQNDGEVTGMTQISLLTVDKDGQPICGQDEPTAALAFKTTVYDKDGNVTANGDKDSTTKYEIVIKNGIQFSDGEPLTIRDVLFNLYVYIDPLYAGSNTIYATNIVGLNRYRSQNPDLKDGEDDDSDAEFATVVTNKMNALYDADSTTANTNWHNVSDELKQDIITVAEKFRNELETDWNTYKGTISSYPEYQFTEDWEVFLFNEGYFGYEYEFNTVSNSQVKMQTADGKYVTQIDIKNNGQEGDYYWLREDMAEALEGVTGDEREELMRQTAIDYVFDKYLYATYDSNGKINYVEPMTTGGLVKVLNEFATGSEVRQQFLNEARSAYYEEIKANGELAVKKVDGINVKKVNSDSFQNPTSGSPLNDGEEYDMLEITINGVDPVAIYNFGFTVAPMHYYSGKIGDIDYVERCKNADIYETDQNKVISDSFGVAYANSTFFDYTLREENGKSSKPVGAGAYKMLNDVLLNGKDCLYERNTYFETVGTGLSNANIKYLTYRSVTEDQLVDVLKKGELDFGMPNCTPDNVSTLSGTSNIVNGSYDAGGFGYVGINPKFIPDKQVRQAIMRSMNVVEITDTYYTSAYSSVIYRPISTTSWVYSGATDAEKAQYFSERKDLAWTDNKQVIIDLVEEAGYTEVGSDGIRYKAGDPNDKLKFTFTIAGETTDHPAFAMFKNAERFLTQCGFEITVKTDIQALVQLAQGGLAVWAAAWTSGVDPDMYQVYHYASKASSVKNWGYDVILDNAGGKYEEEQQIVYELADYIEAGRATLLPENRRPIYFDALDKVMDLAVELPTYQRKDLYVYNSNVIDRTSLNAEPNANLGVIARVWELDYV